MLRSPLLLALLLLLPSAAAAPPSPLEGWSPVHDTVRQYWEIEDEIYEEHVNPTWHDLDLKVEEVKEENPDISIAFGVVEFVLGHIPNCIQPSPPRVDACALSVLVYSQNVERECATSPDLEECPRAIANVPVEGNPLPWLVEWLQGKTKLSS